LPISAANFDQQKTAHGCIHKNDWVQAMNTAGKSNLVAMFNAVTTDTALRAAMSDLLAMRHSTVKTPPKIIFADDDRLQHQDAIWPHASGAVLVELNPDGSKDALEVHIVMGERQNEMPAALATIMHELGHTIQVSSDANFHDYGPDDNHILQEVLPNGVTSWIEGFANFFSFQYDIAELNDEQFQMSECGFLKEDSNSSAQAPRYNGKLLSELNCSELTGWDEMSKEDFLDVELIFASLFLEAIWRIEGAEAAILQGLKDGNNPNASFEDTLAKVVAQLNEDQRRKLAIIFDVHTAFKYSEAELLSLMSLTTLGEYMDPQPLAQGKTGRQILQEESFKTTDANGKTVRYNGFHALDEVSVSGFTQAVLPRLGTSTASQRGFGQASVKSSSQVQSAAMNFATHRHPHAFSEPIDLDASSLDASQSNGTILRYGQ